MEKNWALWEHMPAKHRLSPNRASCVMVAKMPSMADVVCMPMILYFIVMELTYLGLLAVSSNVSIVQAVGVQRRD